MKIRVLSDLHIDIEPFDGFNSYGEDLMVLAGDTAGHVECIDIGHQIAVKYNIPVIVIAGNHEFYRSYENPHHTWEGTIDDLRNGADLTDSVEPGKVTFLENQSVSYDGVRFIGTTLWTDMDYFGPWNFVTEVRVTNMISDYRSIFKAKKGGPIKLADTVARHKKSLAFLRGELEKDFDGKTVVITHHTPSSKSVADEYKTHPATPAFTSRLEDLILDHGPELWIHGHTHHAFDYTLGGTRVVCNPRGYPGEGAEFGFNPTLIVEV